MNLSSETFVTFVTFEQHKNLVFILFSNLLQLLQMLQGFSFVILEGQIIGIFVYVLRLIIALACNIA
jgi:hypothetical protein